MSSTPSRSHKTLSTNTLPSNSLTKLTGMYLLAIFLAVANIQVSPSATSQCKWENTISKLGCICEQVTPLNITAKCHVPNTRVITTYISQPEAVLMLDLSKNNLTELSPNSLDNFVNLLIMNLSGNPLLNLQTLSLNNLPRLMVLDVSRISDWLSINHVQRAMRMLQVIQGTPLDKQCFRCFFSKSFREIEISYVSNITDFVKEMSNAVAEPWARHGACYGRKIYLTDKYFKEMQDIGFTIKCFLPNWCTHQEQLRDIRSISNDEMVKPRYTNRCWRKMNDFSVGVIILASISIFLDSLVFVVTFYSKELREKAATFLVSIIALGDLLSSLYLFIITITRGLVSYDEMIDLSTTVYCKVVGILFIISQGVSVFTAFFMTIERYLSIVYCLNPDIRLHLHIVKKCTVFIFIVSFTMAILPYTALSNHYTLSGHCMPNAVSSDRIEYLAILGSISTILYLTAIPLYFRMYLSIRRSSQELAIQRERKVQKKIFILVVTNMIFFALPFVCFAIIHSTPLRKLISQESIDIFFKTFIYYCYAVSACLNPLLFSFRNDKFINSLKRFLRISPSSLIYPLRPPRPMINN